MKSILSALWNKVNKKYLINYLAGLILSNGRKTCTEIGRFLDVSHDVIYRFFIKQDIVLQLLQQLLIAMIKYFHAQKPGRLVLDDTYIDKQHSTLIELVMNVFNSSKKRTERGLNIPVIAWSNGEITIPIFFNFWVNKKMAQKNYKTRIELSHALILQCIEREIPFEYIIADGAYFSVAMVAFCMKNNIFFEMRIPANRKVNINGIISQLKVHKYLRLIRNERCKTKRCTYYGKVFFITAVKRKNKKGKYSVVYQASNMNIPAKEHVKIYTQRWVIEKVFRTVKQKLGLAHCAARSAEKQTLHISAVFFSYAFLEIEKMKSKMPHPESVVSHLKDAKPGITISKISLLIQNFIAFA